MSVRGGTVSWLVICSVRGGKPRLTGLGSPMLRYTSSGKHHWSSVTPLAPTAVTLSLAMRRRTSVAIARHNCSLQFGSQSEIGLVK